MRDYSKLSDAELESEIVKQKQARLPKKVIPEIQKASQPPDMRRAQEEAFGRGLWQGTREVGQGLTQLAGQAAEGIGYLPKGSYEDYTRQVAAQREAYENDPRITENELTAGAGRTIANIAPFLLIPGGVAGGALQGALEYVPEGSTRLGNTIAGAVFTKVGDWLMKGGTKIYNTLTGKFADNETAKLIEKSTKENVDITARQARPPTPKKNTPEMQVQQAKSSSERQLNRAKNEMLKTNFGGLEKVKEVAQGKGYRAERAKELLKDIENAGDDWQRIIETSGNLKLFRSKLITDQAYNKVGKLAKQHGPVDLKPYVQEIDKLIKLEKKGGDPNPRVLDLLYKTRDGLYLKKAATPASKLLDREGKPLIAAEPEKQILKDLNYDQVRKIRSKMSKRISDFYKKPGSELISTEEVIAAQRLKNKATSMLDSFAKTNGPELEKARKQADTLHKRLIAPYKDKILAKSLSNAAPDEIYNKFIVKGISEEGYGTTRAKKFYAALDERGRAAVRYGMSKQTFDKSFNIHTGEFNPAKYANELRDLTTSRGIFFNKEQKNEVEGLANLFAHVGNKTAGTKGAKHAAEPYILGALLGAGTYKNQFPEESNTQAAGIGIGSVASIAASKKMGGVLINKLMNTDKGRNFLLSSSKIQANTPEMQKLIDGFIKASGIELRKEFINAKNVKYENEIEPSKLSEEELDRRIEELKGVKNR